VKFLTKKISDMLNNLLLFVIYFLSVFATLSLARLVVNFIVALLSSPPKSLELGQKSIIYYGICISYLLSLIIMIW